MNTLEQAIEQEIVETANDINAYLGDESVPLDCHQKDVDAKLMAMKERIKKLFNS